MSTVVRATNLGPIKEIEFELPDDYRGVVLIRGGQGAGKSTLTRGLRAVLGNKVRLNPREVEADGEFVAKSGSVEIGGRKVSVGARQTVKGDLEFGTIEDRMEIEDLINPRGETPEVRNANRIKALLGVTGVKPDITAFYDVVGGKAEMDTLLTPKDQGNADLVELAGKIKRALDARATTVETQAANAEKNRVAAAAAAEGVDLTAEPDAVKLLGSYKAATDRAEKLRGQRDSYNDAQAKAASARAKLADHEAKATTSMAKAQAEFDGAVQQEKDAEAVVVKLQSELLQASEYLSKCTQAKNSARLILDTASETEHTVAAWRDQIEAVAALPNPTDEELAGAALAIEDAQAAVDLGSRVRTAQAKMKEAEVYAGEKERFEKQAAKIREQGKAVFDVLTKQIPAGPLYCAAGVLVVDTADRKAEPFDQLSDGERSKIAFQYAVDAVGEGGMVTLPQQFWDGLSESSKAWAAQYVVDHDVIAFAGEIADGPLRMELYEPTAA